MNRRPRADKLNLAQQLASVPLRNAAARVQPRPTGELEVEVPLVHRGWRAPLAALLRARTRRRYLLEGLGREVFEAIDGRKTFEQLIDEFAARHRLGFFEARALLMQYLLILMKRGLILVALDRSGGG